MQFKFIYKIVVIWIFSLLSFSTFAQAISRIEAPQLLQLIKNKEAPLILDVRTFEEFTAGHVQGAINIPFDILSQDSSSLEKYKHKEIIVYCRSGRRASVVYQALVPLGFDKLIDLNGHMIQWEKLGYPLQKGINKNQ
ncbi:MAG TPA: rhodanese-like domain-containing protein [Psychromonas hadalis]|nr:rhodanese-like domain-containing protein [Psychromonas hadalis]